LGRQTAPRGIRLLQYGDQAIILAKFGFDRMEIVFGLTMTRRRYLDVSFQPIEKL
jgi:hypothetical protein